MGVDPSGPGRPIHLHRVLAQDWESHRDIRLEMLQNAPDAFWFSYADEAVFEEADWRGPLAPGGGVPHSGRRA